MKSQRKRPPLRHETSRSTPFSRARKGAGRARPRAATVRERRVSPAPPSPDTLVIGVGNPLRGDDAAGRLAACALRRRGFAALEVHQLTPEFAEPISRAQQVIFIDADAGLPPGCTRAILVRESATSALDHHATPGGLIRLAREVYGRAPQALIVGIGPESFEFGRPLSKAARRAVKHVAERISTASLVTTKEPQKTTNTGVGVLYTDLRAAGGSRGRQIPPGSCDSA